MQASLIGKMLHAKNICDLSVEDLVSCIQDEFVTVKQMDAWQQPMTESGQGPDTPDEDPDWLRLHLRALRTIFRAFG